MSNEEREPKLQIRIERPCARTWEEFVGDDARRYCSQCSLHVVNGAALTQAEAVDLVQRGTGRVCMRLEIDATGTARFRDAASRLRPTLVARSVRWLATASAAILAACVRSEPTAAVVLPPVQTEEPQLTSATTAFVSDRPAVLDPGLDLVWRREAIQIEDPPMQTFSIRLGAVGTVVSTPAVSAPAKTPPAPDSRK
ncbi:MAG: hypothetical protein JNL28_12270 [Planctomycetes bacterium]|nr:hypothetical protein [Planctomycetota bacterium]